MQKFHIDETLNANQTAELNKKIGSAWNRAYAEVVAEIKKQDKILRKDNLTKQEVTFAIQNLAKSYLDANLPQKPPPENNSSSNQDQNIVVEKKKVDDLLEID